MSEQALIDLGADCVCGDLILNQKAVGQYRNNTFTVTAAGLELLRNHALAAEGGVEEVEDEAPKPRRKKAAAPEAEVAPVAAVTTGFSLSDVDALLPT